MQDARAGARTSGSQARGPAGIRFGRGPVPADDGDGSDAGSAALLDGRTADEAVVEEAGEGRPTLPHAVNRLRDRRLWWRAWPVLP